MKYSMEMKGYFREVNSNSLPAISGVYCVYEATYNQQADTVTLHKLIYIGESDNVNARIAGHEKKPQWKRYVRQDNELCYSSGYAAPADRPRIEAAMIYKHQPPVNTEYKDNFPFDTTRIILTGRTALLYTDFTVTRTSSLAGMSFGHGRR